MSKINKNHIVTKHNVLNEMRSNSMTLQELRLFSIYLSKINPQDVTTRIVRLSLSDFKAVMGLSQIKIAYFKEVALSLLNKSVLIPTEQGGFVAFNLFSVFRVDTEDDGDWYVEINANDEALPLMFEFKGRYFKYELWNALRLKSKNQLRMYETLKQYENIGYRVISIEDLKGMLGIDDGEYPKYNTFKHGVLDACRHALAEYTDIAYTYEPWGQKGRGGKILNLKFNISKNNDYTDPLNLGQFIDLYNLSEDYDYDGYSGIDKSRLLLETGTSAEYENRITFLMDACDNEFAREEIMVLYSLMAAVVPHLHFDELKSHDYLRQKYLELKMRNKKEKVVHRFNYLKKLVELG